MSDVLLLNLDGQPLTLWPLSTISWQQAIKAHFLGKVKILKTYDDWICRSQHLAISMPSVVMMSLYRRHAGKEYGSGSSRDWAAKGTFLLGVKAVVATSY